ncbi:MAG: cell division protein ZapB [Candidatus Solibacter usitatus]|nr:cell division protein ZapB [Candidatus Solibacter usitatus]
MTPAPDPARDEVEILTSLEDRILKAVEMVNALRAENAGLREKLQAVLADQANASSNSDHLQVEIRQLRAEREQVRTRIEKLLSQMESLSAG